MSFGLGILSTHFQPRGTREELENVQHLVVSSQALADANFGLNFSLFVSLDEIHMNYVKYKNMGL